MLKTRAIAVDAGSLHMRIPFLLVVKRECASGL
jgi:hypothetical protein